MKPEDSLLLNYEAAVYAAFGSTQFTVAKPRILVAGSGTFEPCVAALANREAEIVALDLSESALKRLRWHLRRHGLARRVELVRGDLLELDASAGRFDYIVATGVLHHLPRPELGLQKLADRLAPNGVMRLMLYSQFGRSQIYRIREFADALEISRPALLRWAIAKLPPDHPLRAHFQLYTDARTDAGLVDGFLHACDRGFDARDCGAFLATAGLVATRFLHPVGSRPQDLFGLLEGNPALQQRSLALDDWQRLALLDRLRQLETNFNFIACRKTDHEANRLHLRSSSRISLNPTLARALDSWRGRFLVRAVYSRLERRHLPVGRELRRLARDSADSERLASVLGTELLGKYLESLVLLEDRS